jgi:UDP-GlcNAc:undecaprenyl-phosphate GlcNAc-1-phosphate transferase
MYGLLLLGGVSFFLALILTPVVRDLFRKLGVMDHPDNGRKAHPVPIPRAGGVVIVICYLAAFGVLLLTTMGTGKLVWSALPIAARLLPAVCVIFLTGLLDDIYGLKAWHKLVGQVAAAALVCSVGIRINEVGGMPLAPWLSIPLTLFWLTACSNAFNLIDGVDGLAAGMGLCATLTIFAAGLSQDHLDLAMATVPLAACLMGFLRYNFNPASVFLGDSGSLLIGFLLGSYGIIWAEKTNTIMGMTAPMIALAVPLLDTTLALGRRFLRNKPLFGADRGHIHHRLLDRGLSPRAVALLLYVAGGTAALLSLMVTMPRMAAPALALFLTCALIGIRQLRYEEFSIAAKLFVDGSFARLLHSEMTMVGLERNVMAASSIDGYWDAVRGSYRDLGFEQMELQIAGRYFSDGRPDWNDSWVVSVPLGGPADWVRFGKRLGHSSMPVDVSGLGAILRRPRFVKDEVGIVFSLGTQKVRS